MHSYVDFYFSPDGESPLDVAERIRARLGLHPIVGAHDLVFEWSTVEEFRGVLAQLHGTVKGTGTLYRVETIADDPQFVEPVPWPPPLPGGPSRHPAFDSRGPEGASPRSPSSPRQRSARRP